ncbi:hypothetical protein GN157_11055 [Flavobacterium rakeshii]|uniref:Lipoprotein n=1 Tax=Flavobacterium rakeshii TaxID=1038845 RepID=A0A6N8HEW2_9FLAO|nr:hypothetical protein [Flavobacterium rakeshii]MUV04248.1 hypothetical protein [Flavobacterium rakeshii]
MKKAFWFICFLLLLTGCKKNNNNLNVVIKSVNPYYEGKVDLFFIELKTNANDSLYYFAKFPMAEFNASDTIKFTDLPNEKYKLKYLGLLGDTISKSFSLSNNLTKTISVVYDSINTEAYRHKTPISRLKSKDLYTIVAKGGCVASMTSSYTITRENNDYYWIEDDSTKVVLTEKMKTIIQDFEAELLTIKGKGSFSSTGAMTYYIDSPGFIDTIHDRTLNWQGFENMSHIYYKEHINK